MTLVVPALVLDAVREHARGVDDGMEICGRIVFVAGRAVRYVRHRNVATVPRKATFATSWRPVVGEDVVLVHSHPTADARPSAGDLVWAASKPYRNMFAIFSVRDDELAVWKITPDRSGFTRLAVVATGPSTEARHPLGCARTRRVPASCSRPSRSV